LLRADVTRAAKVCVCVALTWAGGCSSLEIRDTYQLPGGASDTKIDIDDGFIFVRFEPATRLSTFGPPGAPVIPTVVKRRGPAEMTLSVSLTLHADHDFSFAGEACIHSDTDVQLCSGEVFVHAYAMSRDDGSAHKDGQGRWQHIAPFFDRRRSWYEVITPSEGAVRFDRAAVYRHYGYLGDPKWGLLAVELVYHIACHDACPKRVAIDAGGLVRIDNVAMAHNELNFHFARVRDYRPTVDPGP
jgi:hypothetical protein